MKKYVSIFALALVMGLGFSSCSPETDEPAGGTKVEKMAGHWMVDIDAVDDDGNPIPGGAHYFGYDEARIPLFTYNTADNSDTKMWIDDNGWFDLSWYYGNPAYPNYSFKNLVNVDLNNLTFTSDDAENLSGAYGITIEGGKILMGAAHYNNGTPADSIVFYVKYTDDPWYPDDGYAKYKVSGIRYSGFPGNI